MDTCRRFEYDVPFDELPGRVGRDLAGDEDLVVGYDGLGLDVCGLVRSCFLDKSLAREL